MSDWVSGLAARLRKENGQALGEYSLILAFIAMVCIVALGALGLVLAGHIDALAGALP